jgi:hypothetical protein
MLLLPTGGYIVGSVNHEGDKIKRLAVENNKLINDATLVKMVEEDAKFIQIDKDYKAGPVAIKNLFIEKITSGDSGDSGAGVQSDSIDGMIKKVEERVNEKTDTAVRNPHPVEVKVKIYTKDGNIFTGTLMKETSDQIVIRSSLGVIKISKSKIYRRIDL